MNILAVCLGGTIASRTGSDGVMSLGEFKFNRSFFEKIMRGPEYRVITPAYYSSENATLNDYRTALKGIYDEVASERPDAILILHGTDSMAYFAQLAVRTLSILKIPVVIVGSKLPQDAAGSDAQSNLKMALGILDAAVEGKTRNKTFGVVYNDSFTGMASFVPAQQITSADIKGDYKRYDNESIDYSAAAFAKPAVDFLSRETSPEDNILVIPAAPSFPLDAIGDKGYGSVLINCYHSGTADSVTLPVFVSRAVSCGHKVFMAPIPKARKIGKKDALYESSTVLLDAGVTALADMPFEGAWAEVAIKG